MLPTIPTDYLFKFVAIGSLVAIFALVYRQLQFWNAKREEELAAVAALQKAIDAFQILTADRRRTKPRSGQTFLDAKTLSRVELDTELANCRLRAHSLLKADFEEQRILLNTLDRARAESLRELESKKSPSVRKSVEHCMDSIGQAQRSLVALWKSRSIDFWCSFARMAAIGPLVAIAAVGFFFRSQKEQREPRGIETQQVVDVSKLESG